ncbi:alpha/beta fold hydrolase [Virgisporangium aliadipatigenens]|uniref:alpha/beta fold hydrolase n=1 Tax=Virgisporangium aliadipatigenens TaxID=741659 RepID=UPI00194206A9|nr:alpha/beta hydrolase [Virgisporangium aliadipatigenens]
MKRARLAPDDAVTPSVPLPPPWPGEAVLLDGAKTFVRRTPARSKSAEPALYVHGLGGSAANWTDLADLLAHRFDGEAIDLPGFGHSAPARRYTIEALANRVIRWIEHSGRGAVHLVGNSMGGAVSVRVAGIRPDLVRTLTLISPAMPFLDPRRSAQGPVVPFALLPQAHRLVGWRMGMIPPDDMARMVLAACVGDVSRIPEQRRAEAREEIELRYTVPWYADAYVRTLRGLVTCFVRAYLPGAGSIWQIARRISAPTLVIGGDADKLVDIRVPYQVARAVPDSRLLTLGGVGHVAMLERPTVVARAVIGMLDELESTAAAAA